MIATDWLRRIWYLIHRRRLERELEQDMEAHREMMGEPRGFGNTLRLREESRDVWGWNWLDDLWRDLRAAAHRLGNPQVWMPIDQIDYFIPGGSFKTSWNESVSMYGRLKPGISATAARDQLRNVFGGLSAEQPQLFQRTDWLEPVSGSDHFRDAYQRERDWMEVAAIAGVPALILLIACANLGNLTLSRSVARIRELSVRVALGASRWRVICHLLTESLLLAALGVTGAMLVAYWTLAVMKTADPSFPPVDPFHADWRLLLASGMALLLVTAVLGLIPALKISRRDLVETMKDGGQQATAGIGRTRVRTVLIAVQVGSTCVLLMVAGMFIRGFQRIQADPGFEVNKLAVLDLSHDQYGLKESEARNYWTAMRETIAASPQTESLTLVSRPLATLDELGLRIAGTQIEPNFFDVMKIPLLVGRTFRSDDDPQSTVVVSRRVATAMFGSLDVLGKGFPKSRPSRTIVGVVNDARVISSDDVKAGQYYLPLTDQGLRFGALFARARTDPEQLVSLMRNAARSSDERFIPEVRLVASYFEESARRERNLGLAVSGLAGLALLLACIGIFSAVSYLAALRQKEIGIRIVLGANRGTIVQLMTEQLGRPLFLSALAGLFIGSLITRSLALKHPDYWMTFDPILLVAVALICATTTLTAALIPSLRTLRSDVLHALRRE